MKKLSAAFVGQGSFLLRCAEMWIKQGHDVRCMISETHEVHLWARERNLPVFCLPEAAAQLRGDRPIDHLFSIANFEILPADLLHQCKGEAINFHDGPLPRYAGMNVTNWAILNGEHEHGVTWHVMVPKVDAGAVLKQRIFAIRADDTAISLNYRCYQEAGTAFAELIEDLTKGTLHPRPQDLRQRTFFARWKRPWAAGTIDWRGSAASISALHRALDHGRYPNQLGCTKLFLGDRIAIVGTLETLDAGSDPPGTLLKVTDEELHVQAEGAVLTLGRFSSPEGEPIGARQLVEDSGVSVGQVLPQLEPSAADSITEAASALARAEAFWIRRLGNIQSIDAPYSVPRRSGGSGRRALELSIDIDFSPLSAARGDTLAAAFLVYLARVQQREVFDVGYRHLDVSPGPADLSRLYFAEVVPLRLDFRGCPSFREALIRVSEAVTTLQAQRTFARDLVVRSPLTDDINAERRPPLLMVGVDRSGGTDGLSAFADAGLVARIDDAGHTIRWEFDPAVIPEQGARRIQAEFTMMLRSVISDPDESLWTARILSDADQDKLLVKWNATKRDYDFRTPLHRVLESRAISAPDALALIHGDRELTYGELNARSSRLANHLLSLGVEPGMLIGVAMERSLDMVVSLCGILRAGGAYVPLDPSYPPDRLDFMIKDSGLRFLVTEPRLLEDLTEIEARRVFLDHSLDDVEDFSGVEVGGHDLAYVIYTSGSTGLPKGVEITHGSLMNFLRAMAEEPGLDPTDRLLAVTTLSFDISGLELFLPMIVGASVVVVDREVAADGIQLAACIEKSGATVMQATPATWRLLLETGWKGSPDLRVWCGGETLPRALANRLLDCGCELWNLYGPTETTIWSTVHRVEPGSGAVPVGRPIGNTEIYILGHRRELLPIGATGELFIGGSGLARGYLNRQELTAERFVPHPYSENEEDRLYRTGDLARYLPDGNIEILGRLDQQVKLRGFRIELGEIEAALNGHEGVAEAVVVMVGDDLAERRLVAYFVPRSRPGPSVQDLLGELRRKLPDYMVPSLFVALEQMPRTANNKVDRRALPDPDQSRLTSGDTYVAPGTREETALAEIWAEVLAIEKVGIHDNFFDIGGNSMLAVRIFAGIEEKLGVRLPLATLFKAATIESLAKVIKQRPGTARNWSCLVPIQPEGTKPPLFCIHAEGGEVLFYRDLARFLGPDQPLYGCQAYGLDGRQEPDRTVEAMASRYIREIRVLQPEGPYYLGGHCFGAVVAFEMAQQLHAQGQDIGLLALLDGAAPVVRRSLSDLLRHSAVALRRNPLGFVKYLVRTELPYRRHQIMEKVFAKLNHEVVPDVREMSPAEAALEAVGEAINSAYHAYEPMVYPGHIISFVNSERIHLSFYEWSKYAAKGLEVHPLPGTPQTSMEEPSMRVLAEKLRGFLEGEDEAVRNSAESEV